MSPQQAGANFTFSFPTASGLKYTLQMNTNLLTTNWLTLTNFTGNGLPFLFVTPITNAHAFFRLSVGSVSPPLLTIIHSGTNVILTWPTNVAGFTLQSATNLASPAVWTNVSPGPVVVNGRNAVTNPISGTQKFYRLRQ